MTGPRCAPVPGLIQRENSRLAPNLPNILADLVKRERVSSVVLGAAWAGYGEEMQMEVEGRRIPLNTTEGMDAFFASLEGYIRLLQGEGAKVYLVLRLPDHQRFNPSGMLTRSLSGFRVGPTSRRRTTVRGIESPSSIDARLQSIGERTVRDAARSSSGHLRQRVRMPALLRSR